MAEEGGYEYCDQAGLYIYGAVYLNWASSEWQFVETPLLHTQPPWGWANLNDLLDELGDYATNQSIEIPELCSDLGCYPPETGSTSGGTEPDPHVSGYTTADNVFHRH